MPPSIDAHQHFWKYSAAEYSWIGEDMSALRRDFLPADLHAEMTRAGIDGSITVQARQTVEETEWLLDLASKNQFIRGVVGWVPLISPNIESALEKFAANKKLLGVRHVLQDEPNDKYILRDDFNRGIGALAPRNLAYDILIFEKHLPQTIQFVDKHPNQRFILDHIAKPRIRAGVFEPWRTNLRELARRENVWCKLSGVVTEADYKNWTEPQVRRYIDAALDAFGPKRLMFGSDWPVCLAATTYRGWTSLVRSATAQFSNAERDWIFGRAASNAYLTDLA